MIKMETSARMQRLQLILLLHQPLRHWNLGNTRTKLQRIISPLQSLFIRANRHRLCPPAVDPSTGSIKCLRSPRRPQTEGRLRVILDWRTPGSARSTTGPGFDQVGPS